MKRTFVLRPWHACAVSGLLSLCLLAGCSGGDAVGNAAVKTVRDTGLTPSEYVALKTASKGAGSFKKALMKKQMEQLQEQGIVVETKPSGRKSNRPR